MTIRFDHPELLWLLLLAAPVALLGWRAMVIFDRLRRWTAIVLRVVVLAVIVFILAGMQAVRKHTDITVVAVVDQSESVEQFAKFSSPTNPNEAISPDQWVRNWLLRAAAGRRPDDRFALISFDAVPTVRIPPSLGIGFDSGTVSSQIEGTDPASAIDQGLAEFPPDSAKQLLLVWDGNPTVPMDTVLGAAPAARAAGVPINVLPVEYEVPHQVVVDEVHAPPEARLGQTIALRIVMTATEPAPGAIILKHDGQTLRIGRDGGEKMPVTADDWQRQELTPGNTTGPSGGGGDSRYVFVRRVEVPMQHTGANNFQAIFEPGPGIEPSPKHHRAESFTYVHGKGRILFVDHGDPGGEILPDTLREHGIELDVVSEASIPFDLEGLQPYDAVVLQNVPADRTTLLQQQLLRRYVNDLGGGLVMIGGPNSFGAGDWTGTDIDAILPLNCQLPDLNILPSGALVIIIDRSGSMGEGVAGTMPMLSKEDLANESAVKALQTLQPQDLIGVIAFDTEATWVVPLQRNDRPNATKKLIESISPGGGTMIGPALNEAYEALAKITPEQAAVKHVILITDGQSGDKPQCEQIALKMRQKNITLSTIGICNGDKGDLDEAMLGKVAFNGGGRYHFVDDPRRLPQVFIKEVRTLRKNLIKEKVFTPKLIAGSPITMGITAPPPLKGLVVTADKNDPRIYTAMRGPENEPLFTHWQVGLGRVAAFTSDASNRWAEAWLNWGGYADFWTRMMRAIARPSAARDYDLSTTFRGTKLHIRLDATRPSTPGPGSGAPSSSAAGEGPFRYFAQIPARVIVPDGTGKGASTPVSIDLKQTEPGIYEAEVPAPYAGNYIVNLFVPGAGGISGGGGGGTQVVFGGISRPAGEELRVFRSNRVNLEAVAAASGGRVLDPREPQAAGLFDRGNMTASVSVRPMWRPLLFCLLALFLLDVAARRIAWDIGGSWRWVLEHADALVGLLRPRPVEAEATLAALQKKAAEVDKRLAAQVSEIAAAQAVPAATAKFEARPEFVASEDFAAAVGGAKAEEERVAPELSGNGPSSEEGPTTTRLLDAKRRAAERIKRS